MKLNINISPCPNDTFMFDAMLNGRIGTDGWEFDTAFADIEELNAMALGGDVDVCKVSYAVVPAIADRYRVLTSGSALGRGNGPLMVARGDVDTGDSSLRIAVPGGHTTANLLVQRLFPALADRTPVLFSEIAERIAAGEFDVGVLIHEGRFTYAAKGLKMVADLGAEWERATGLPLPLGAIVVSRRLPERTQAELNHMLRRSIWHAFQYPEESYRFVQSHAQELSRRVLADHIALFVNDYSVDLGAEGRRAVAELTGIGDETIFVA